jgi:hypothetical protein
MSRFEIELATWADDGELRGLLSATPMDGNVSIAFAREPSYFAAAVVEGSSVQVGVVRDRQAGRIVGMGSRAITRKYVNGASVAVGYLSGLRLLKEFRGRAGILARGYRFLRELHEDRRVPYYLTTIAEDNASAVKLLSSGRGGLPVYRPWGKFHTLSIAATRRPARCANSSDGVVVRPAHADDRSAILEFLNKYGPARQFFPVYETNDLFSGSGTLQGVYPEDVLLAVRNRKIVGTLATWDQRRFKQTLVHGYRGWLRSTRLLYNAWATLRRRPTLPAAGSIIEARMIAIPVVSHDELNVFRQLIGEAVRRSAMQGDRMLLIGLHESDPLLPVAREYAGREYVTNLYLVYWPEEVPSFGPLTQRVPYLELGCL